MDTVANVKPLKRSERLKKAPPRRELPKRGELQSLFAKYDVQAPRYTSYPPATQFNAGFDSGRYSDHISHVMSGGDRNEISIYVHLPFCDTLCYFCGCNMLISNNREKIAEYLEYLKREITMVRELMESDPIVVQMHWGGGSPTHLLPSEITDLGAHLRKTFSFAQEAECSIEIDPRGVTLEHILAIQSAGFNRASIGVQDFSEDVQVAINRVQPRSITEQVIDWCRSHGIESINLDLIYGLPYQTTESFLNTLKTVEEISPDRIAVYNFAYVPWIKPHQNLIAIDTLPVATTKLALLELAIHELGAAGYEYLGMDHFAKQTDTLLQAQRAGTLHRNFQGYSTLAGKDLIGFGISAIGRIENAFAQNVKELPDYYRMIDEGVLPIERGYELTADDEVREYVIMEMMCNMRVEKADVERLFAVPFDSYFERALAQLRTPEADGLCRVTPEAIEVTDLGRFFLRNIAVAFDAYIGDVADRSSTQKMYSRAV
jgi:oxygen-independent coproporphyrinogen-3 oxidase